VVQLSIAANPAYALRFQSAVELVLKTLSG
jgi:hypothetical protein